jgi:integrase
MHFHDLRHTFVSLMAKADALPAEIARHLGHVDGGVLVASR